MGHEYKEIKLNEESQKPKTVKILITQPTISENDFTRDADGCLMLYNNIDLVHNFIVKTLELAKQKEVNCVVFPECSVRLEEHDEIKMWSSENKNIIVIAGTTFIRDEKEKHCYNTSSIFLNGEKYATEKFTISKHESTNEIDSKIHSRDDNLFYFTNSVIGNFGILICADLFGKDSYVPLMQFSKDDKLDFLFVLAFQDDAKQHHQILDNFIQNSVNGLYGIYCNILNDKPISGKSSFFAVDLNRSHNDNLSCGFIADNNFQNQNYEMPNIFGCFIVEANLEHKIATRGARNEKTYKLSRPYEFYNDEFIYITKTHLLALRKNNSLMYYLIGIIRKINDKKKIDNICVNIIIGLLIFTLHKDLNIDFIFCDESKITIILSVLYTKVLLINHNILPECVLEIIRNSYISNDIKCHFQELNDVNKNIYKYGFLRILLSFAVILKEYENDEEKLKKYLASSIADAFILLEEYQCNQCKDYRDLLYKFLEGIDEIGKDSKMEKFEKWCKKIISKTNISISKESKHYSVLSEIVNDIIKLDLSDNIIKNIKEIICPNCSKSSDCNKSSE